MTMANDEKDSLTVDGCLAELDRQAATLDVRGDALGRLRDEVSRLAREPLHGNLPMCLVVNERPFPAAAMMTRIVSKGVSGVIDMTPKQPDDFLPIESVILPDAAVYLLWDVDTGRSRMNMSPEDSLKAILAEGRSPLTLEEGVVLAVHFPEMFTDTTRLNCIQMPGSRIAGDQRVPSLWFSKGAPRLGWCWDRNVHTWLASASARRRIEP